MKKPLWNRMCDLVNVAYALAEDGALSSAADRLEEAAGILRKLHARKMRYIEKIGAKTVMVPLDKLQFDNGPRLVSCRKKGGARCVTTNSTRS